MKHARTAYDKLYDLLLPVVKYARENGFTIIDMDHALWYVDQEYDRELELSKMRAEERKKRKKLLKVKPIRNTVNNKPEEIL